MEGGRGVAFCALTFARCTVIDSLRRRRSDRSVCVRCIRVLVSAVRRSGGATGRGGAWSVGRPADGSRSAFSSVVGRVKRRPPCVDDRAGEDLYARRSKRTERLVAAIRSPRPPPPSSSYSSLAMGQIGRVDTSSRSDGRRADASLFGRAVSWTNWVGARSAPPFDSRRVRPPVE